MTQLDFSGIGKSYGALQALSPTDLTIAPGEFLTLLGPSGSGKTTLLNICAGYIAPSTGSLRLGGRDITALPPAKRNMGMVFQNYALFPHMTVADNVAYGLRARRRPKAEIAARVTAVLRLVQMEGLAARSVRALSGGQQQRVALARAMVIEPDILLMDEPLGALDRQLRREVQLEIRRLHQAAPRTTLYVTHDQEEALVMSDRIAVMQGGRVAQIGSAEDLYQRPATSFVARFLGESNLLPGVVVRLEAGRAWLHVPGLPHAVEGEAAPGLAVGADAAALVRPEVVKPGAPGVSASLQERLYLGELLALRYLLPNGQTLWCRQLSGTPEAPADTTLGWLPSRILPETPC